MKKKELNRAVIGCGVIANEMAQGFEKMGRTLYSVANRTHEKAVDFAKSITSARFMTLLTKYSPIPMWTLFI